MAGKPSDASVAMMIALIVFSFSLTRQLVADALGSGLVGTLAAAAAAFLVAWPCVRYTRQAQ